MAVCKCGICTVVVPDRRAPFAIDIRLEEPEHLPRVRVSSAVFGIHHQKNLRWSFHFLEGLAVVIVIELVKIRPCFLDLRLVAGGIASVVAIVEGSVGLIQKIIFSGR